MQKRFLSENLSCNVIVTWQEISSALILPQDPSPEKGQNGALPLPSGNENSAQSFSDRSFWKRDIRANDPRMSTGYPSQKLPLWADFSFLIHRSQRDICTPNRPVSETKFLGDCSGPRSLLAPLFANPFSPYSIQNAPNPKFVQNLFRRLFLGVPVRWTEICQKFVKI